MNKTLLLALSCCGLLAAGKLAAAELGDPAPPLQIAEWVKGKAVTLPDGKKKGKQFYVIEFWATWCPPCRESIPHLTELSKRFKNVTFIGISGERPERVKPFVQMAGDEMAYTVAVDQEDGTSEAYMGGYGVDGIPYAFIVDNQGRVAWHGHPLEGLEETLTEVVAGKYDIAKAKKRAQAQSLLEQFIRLVSGGGEEKDINEVGQALEALDKDIGGVIRGRKFETAEIKKVILFRPAVQEYRQALFAGQPEAEVEKLAAAAAAVAPKDVVFADVKQELQTQYLFQQYVGAVSEEGNAKLAADLGGKLGALKLKNPSLLQEMAQTLLADARIKQRDLPLALKLAQAGFDAAQGKDASVTETYARALFDNGQVAEAIRFQKQAIAAAKDDFERDRYKETLKTYSQKPAKK